MSGQFEALMQELGTLQSDQEVMTKALPADDGKDEAKIQAAAAEGGLGDEDEDDGDMVDKEDDEMNERPAMAKSFRFTLEDGTEVEAQDGAEMVKSLQNRVEASEANFAKAMESAVTLIKGQNGMIKSLTERVAKLSGEGRGRKTVVSVVEKPEPGASAMAKSLAPEGMSSDQFFAKALEAQAAGKISGQDIAIAETYLNRGQAIPEALVKRVMA